LFFVNSYVSYSRGKHRPAAISKHPPAISKQGFKNQDQPDTDLPCQTAAT